MFSSLSTPLGVGLVWSNGAKKDLWLPPQEGPVSCDSSSLVDPLKLSMKSHTQTFSEENLRHMDKLVSIPFFSE